MGKGNYFPSAGLIITLCLVVPSVFAATVPSTELASAAQWRSIGPYRGGRVTSVAGVAGQENLYYMTTAGGGVWKSDDYGNNWRNISDKDFGTGNIGAIAVAPSNPKIIYVGTGDPAGRNTILTGDGMYKSTDGGKSWIHIGLENTRIISWIIVDPKDANVVYVAAMGNMWASNPERGVYKSEDGGATWKKVLFVDDKTGAITLAMDSSNPQVLYASTWEVYRRPWMLSSGGPGSRLYKSTDGGTTWTNISHNTGLPESLWGKVTVAVAPSDPNVVYTLMQAKYQGEIGGLFRSDDAGQSWKLVNNSPAITQRAMYYMRVYVDPKDPNTIFIPNTSIQVSHDGGKTLSRMQPPHGDNHAFWFNPDNPQIFIEGNDGGATVTRDGGRTWSSELNQPTGQFYHANLDAEFPFNIYASQQDDGSYVGPSAVAAGGLPPTWPRVAGGEASWVVPKPNEPWITFAANYYSDEFQGNRRTGLVTQVSPWPEFKFGLAGTEIKYRWGYWYRPAVFAPHNPNKLLVGANVVFETSDAGVVPWKQISPDLTRNDKSKQQRSGGPISADMVGQEMFDTLSSIAVSPLTDDTIWAGSDDGLVHVTTDGGAHWNQVRPSRLPTWSTVTCIEPSHTEAGTAYVSASRYQWGDFHPYVYKTTDHGKHWTEITAGLPPDQYVTSVREDPNAPNLLFVGTSKTAYMSLDGGAHWQPLTLNLPTVQITDIAIQPEQHAVVLATYGRAFWVLDQLQYLEQLGTAQVSKNAPYLFKPQQTWLVKRSVGGSGGAEHNEGENLPPGLTVFFHLPADYDGHTPVKLSFTDASGKLINSILPRESDSDTQVAHAAATRLHPGMNHVLWNLRYPTATKVKGAYHAGRSVTVPIGPEVVPGTYYAELTYNGQSWRQPFVVKLDPRLDTTQSALEQRFDLLMRIQTAINELDITLNQATALRSGLEQAVRGQQASANEQRSVLADLDRDIDAVINFRIQSSRGFDVYPPRLRSWLSAIYNRVDFAFVQPTGEMKQVANEYIGNERDGVARLRADIARANALLARGEHPAASRGG